MKNRAEIKKLTDKELIALFQDDCNYAFDCLYQRHYQAVYRYLRYLTRNNQTAEDLTQDIFVNILICFKENKFMGTDFFSQYLKKLCYFTFFKSKRNNKEVLTDCDYYFENLTAPSEDCEQLTNKEETNKQLLCLVNTLPKNKQNILYMHFYDKNTFNIIAQRYNVSQSTIMSQYYTSIQTLSIMANKSNLRFAI